MTAFSRVIISVNVSDRQQFWANVFLLGLICHSKFVAGNHGKNSYENDPDVREKSQKNPPPVLREVFRGNFVGAIKPLDATAWRIENDCSVQNPSVFDPDVTQNFYRTGGFGRISTAPCPANEDYKNGVRSIESKRKFDLWKGELEFSVKIPTGSSVTFTTFGDAGSIMMTISTNRLLTGGSFLSTGNAPSKTHTVPENFFEDFHDYSVSWLDDEIQWSLDQLVIRRTALDPDERVQNRSAMMRLRIEVHGLEEFSGKIDETDNYVLLRSVVLRTISLAGEQSSLQPAVLKKSTSGDAVSEETVADKPVSNFTMLATAGAVTVLLAALGMSIWRRDQVALSPASPLSGQQSNQHSSASPDTVYLDLSQRLPANLGEGHSPLTFQQNIQIETTFRYEAEIPIAGANEHELLIQQMVGIPIARPNISHACFDLNIPADYSQWDIAMTRRWLFGWACPNFGIPDLLVFTSNLTSLDGTGLFGGLYSYNQHRDSMFPEEKLQLARSIWVDELQQLMVNNLVDQQPLDADMPPEMQAVPQQVPEGPQNFEVLENDAATNKPILWKFLRRKLADPSAQNMISWIDRNRGLFIMTDSEGVARAWGQAKNNSQMTYDKMSRSIRKFYKPHAIPGLDRSEAIFKKAPDDHTYFFSLTWLNQAELLQITDIPEESEDVNWDDYNSKFCWTA